MVPQNLIAKKFVYFCFALFAAGPVGNSYGQAVAENTAQTANKEAAGQKPKFETYQRKIPGTEVQFEMVPINAGTATLGSPKSEDNRQDDEGPQVNVPVDAFWIGKHEVTWGEFKRYMELCDLFGKFNDQKIRPVNEKNKVDAISAPSNLYDPSFVYEVGQHPKQPAVGMSQFAAKQYTKWLSLLTGEFYRLPTEAEWEYACRAGTKTAYHFGDDPSQFGDYGVCYENAEDETHKVGSFKPNAWGLHDMHGNVSEWVLDQYFADRYSKLKKQSSIDSKRQLTVAWPNKLYPRVVRGGSWDSDPSDCRSARRLPSDDDQWRSSDPNSPQSPWWFASQQALTIGFRVVRPLNPPPRHEWGKFHDADIDSIRRHVRQRVELEGKGEYGLVDPQLPAAIQKLNSGK